MQPKKKNAKMTVKKGKKLARATAKKKVSPKKKIEKKTESDKKPKSGKTLLIAQEIKFARLLAHNDKRVRDNVLKRLKKWLTVRSQSSFAFTESDFMRLWKGLFYCMWMSDKPLVQEELAESLSNIVHCYNSLNTALLYTKCTLKSLAAEWFGIDRYRLDKFEMLLRKIIRQTFLMCKKQSWNEQSVVGVAKVFEEILLDSKICLGFNFHITDVYMEELAKVSDGKLPKKMVTEFVRPYIIHLVSTSDMRQIKHIVKNIFRYLIYQSDVGMDYAEKFQAWRDAGFPCQSIDEMQKVEISDDEDGEIEEDEDEEIEEEEDTTDKSKSKPLDPRAGRVDVEIPQIPFDPVEIAQVLKENKFHKLSTTNTRKHITRLIEDFSKLSEGNMPIGIKKILMPDQTRINPYDAAEELLTFDSELYSDSNRNTRKRKRNDSLLELEEVSEDNNKNIKKQKNVECDSEQVENDTKGVKQTKVKLMVKKKSKKLNVVDPVLNKKLKKSSKKVKDNTFTECIDSSNISISNESISKGSTSSNWNIDETVLPSTNSVTPLVLGNKKSAKKAKKAKKTKVSLEKKADSNPVTNVSWLTPVLTRLEEEKKTPTNKNSAIKLSPKTSSSKKKVKIMLQRNTAQNTSEYIRQILQSPAIPFDANRKPKAGVLKSSPLPSPVNPFYRRKIL